MIVVSISCVPPKLRGFLTKYLWEISTGVYVGDVNSRIRDTLWKRILDHVGLNGRAIMAFSANNEQGFDFLTVGTRRTPVDYEGLRLIMMPSHQLSLEQTKTHCIETDHTYVVLDFETTGLDTETDHILEVGAILVKNSEIVDEYNQFISVEVPPHITKLTGITQEMANRGQNPEHILKELADFISDQEVIGYNVRMFDSKLLRKECLRYGVRFPLKKVVDVMELVRRKSIGASSYKMQDVAAYLGIISETSHRALSDCRTCNEIYQWVLRH